MNHLSASYLHPTSAFEPSGPVLLTPVTTAIHSSNKDTFFVLIEATFV